MRAGLAALALALPAVAAAHPLGNFTVNRYAALRVEAGMLSVRYVVDMAEIPAYQEIAALDRNRNGALDPDERDAYLGRKPGELAENLALTIDGTVVPLVPRAQSLELPAGAGGLPTLRLEVFLAAPLPSIPARSSSATGTLPGGPAGGRWSPTRARAWHSPTRACRAWTGARRCVRTPPTSSRARRR